MNTSHHVTYRCFLVVCFLSPLLLSLADAAPAPLHARASPPRPTRRRTPLSWRRRRSLIPVVYLTSWTGYNLAIAEDGHVYTTDNDADNNGKLEKFAVDSGMVVLRGLHHHKFLTFHADGSLATTTRMTRRCHFRERRETDNAFTYQLRSHPGWYIGITDAGDVTSAPVTISDSQKFTFRMTYATS